MAKKYRTRIKKIGKDNKTIIKIFYDTLETIREKYDNYLSEENDNAKHIIFEDIIFRLRGLVTGNDALIISSGLYKEFFFPCTTYRRHINESSNYHGFIEVIYEGGKPYYRRRKYNEDKSRGFLGYFLWLKEYVIDFQNSTGKISREQLIKNYGDEVVHQNFTTYEIKELLRKNSKYSIPLDKINTLEQDVKDGKQVDIQPIINANKIIEMSIISSVEELFIAAKLYENSKKVPLVTQVNYEKVFSIVYLFGNYNENQYYFKHLSFKENPRKIRDYDMSFMFDNDKNLDYTIIELHPIYIENPIKNRYSIALTRESLTEALKNKNKN